MKAPAYVFVFSALLLSFGTSVVRADNDTGRKNTYSVDAAYVVVPFKEKARLLDKLLAQHDLGTVTDYSPEILRYPAYTVLADVEGGIFMREGFVNEYNGPEPEIKDRMARAQEEFFKDLLRAAPKYDRQFSLVRTRDSLLLLCIEKLQKPEDVATVWSACGVLGAMGKDAKRALPFLSALLSGPEKGMSLTDEGYTVVINIHDAARYAIKKIEGEEQ